MSTFSRPSGCALCSRFPFRCLRCANGLTPKQIWRKFGRDVASQAAMRSTPSAAAIARAVAQMRARKVGQLRAFDRVKQCKSANRRQWERCCRPTRCHRCSQRSPRIRLRSRSRVAAVVASAAAGAHAACEVGSGWLGMFERRRIKPRLPFRRSDAPSAAVGSRT